VITASRAEIVAASAALEHRAPRSTWWGLVDEATYASSDLAARLWASWGPGIVYLSGVMQHRAGLPGLTSAATDELVRAVTIRCWWSDDPRMDAERVLQSARNGAVPLQFMWDDVARATWVSLSPELQLLTMSVSRVGAIPRLSDDDVAQRAVALQSVLGRAAADGPSNEPH
jgi:hypothetical protein